MVEFLEIKIYGVKSDVLPDNILIEAKMRDGKPIAISWLYYKPIGFSKDSRVTCHCTGSDQTHFRFENPSQRLRVDMEKRIFDSANWHKNLEESSTIMTEGYYTSAFVSPAVAIFD